MKLRMLKRWRMLVEGKVVELPDGMANTLIRRKFAVELPDDHEVAALAVPETQVRRRRGRPGRYPART